LIKASNPCASDPRTSALLLDIEGTTTPIAFVFEVLFPYAKRNLRRHLDEHSSSAEYRTLLDRLRDDRERDQRDVIDHVEWLMEHDRKTTALKELQGRIWEEGYRRGELVGAVFDDVSRAFERSSANRIEIAIFSSGSVLAQQLLFRHSSAGDLSRFISRYFDTTTGSKTSVESYRRIAETMATPPQTITFVSDVVAELDAASAAGINAVLSVRPGNHPPPPDHRYPVIRTFDELSAAAAPRR